MAAFAVVRRLRPVVVAGLVVILSVFLAGRLAAGDGKEKFLVIAYVHGGAQDLEQYPLQYLTHMNYCFLRLHGNRLEIKGERDSVGITRLVALKAKHPGALEIALRSPAFYVGALGSVSTQAKRIERLRAAGFGEVDLARLHAPIGLELGAHAPEEIALSILAEIVAVRNGLPGRR